MNCTVATECTPAQSETFSNTVVDSQPETTMGFARLSHVIIAYKSPAPLFAAPLFLAACPCQHNVKDCGQITEAH